MTCKLCKLISVFLLVFALMLADTAGAVERNIYGDADGDGKVTIKDVTCIQRIIAKLPVGGDFSKSVADVDGNGEINIADATYIQKWLVQIETPYLIGEQIDETTTKPTKPTTTQSTQTTIQCPTDTDGWGRDIIRP